MFDLTRRRLLTKTSVAVKSGKRYEAVHQSLTAPGYSRVLRVLFPIRCCDLELGLWDTVPVSDRFWLAGWLHCRCPMIMISQVLGTARWKHGAKVVGREGSGRPKLPCFGWL